MMGPKGFVTREQIHAALFAKLITATGIQNASRVPVSWDAIAQVQCPALIYDEAHESYHYVTSNLGAKVVIHADVYLVFANAQISVPFGTETLIPVTGINAALDAIDAVLVPDAPSNRTTLGGLVEHAYIEGEVIIGDAPKEAKSVAIIPLQILVTNY